MLLIGGGSGGEAWRYGNAGSSGHLTVGEVTLTDHTLVTVGDGGAGATPTDYRGVGAGLSSSFGALLFAEGGGAPIAPASGGLRNAGSGGSGGGSGCWCGTNGGAGGSNGGNGTMCRFSAGTGEGNWSEKLAYLTLVSVSAGPGGDGGSLGCAAGGGGGGIVVPAAGYPYLYGPINPFDGEDALSGKGGTGFGAGGGGAGFVVIFAVRRSSFVVRRSSCSSRRQRGCSAREVTTNNGSSTRF